MNRRMNQRHKEESRIKNQESRRRRGKQQQQQKKDMRRQGRSSERNISERIPLSRSTASTVSVLYFPLLSNLLVQLGANDTILRIQSSVIYFPWAPPPSFPPSLSPLSPLSLSFFLFVSIPVLIPLHNNQIDRGGYFCSIIAMNVIAALHLSGILGAWAWSRFVSNLQLDEFHQRYITVGIDQHLGAKIDARVGILKWISCVSRWVDIRNSSIISTETD